MQARYYDPVIGRFYSNDPVGFTGDVTSFNRYSYVGNNPYKYTDPDGRNRILAIAGKYASKKYRKIRRDVKRFLRDNGVIASSPKSNMQFNEEGVPSGDSPDVESGKEPDPADKSGKLTKSGRALQKHGSRPSSAFPPATGNADDKNQQGQGVLEDIVNDPDATSTDGNRFGGSDVTSPDGRGARFDQKGKFRGFLEPKQNDKQ